MAIIPATLNILRDFRAATVDGSMIYQANIRSNQLAILRSRNFHIHAEELNVVAIIEAPSTLFALFELEIGRILRVLSLDMREKFY